MYTLYNMDHDEPPGFHDFERYSLDEKEGVLSNYGVSAKNIKDHFKKTLRM